MTRSFPARVAGGLLAAAVAVAAAGCGGSDKPAGTVGGKVNYNGTPVTTGAVNFLSKTGAAAQAKLTDTGEYAVPGELDAGEYTVYVTPPVPEPQAPGTKPPPPKKFEVPPKYRDPGSSGLIVTVKTGKNDIPVDIR